MLAYVLLTITSRVPKRKLIKWYSVRCQPRGCNICIW